MEDRWLSVDEIGGYLGRKIKDEDPFTTQKRDIGFRVLKMDSSNMADSYYTPYLLVDRKSSIS